jgi:hypothetical protein
MDRFKISFFIFMWPLSNTAILIFTKKKVTIQPFPIILRITKNEIAFEKNCVIRHWLVYLKNNFFFKKVSVIVASNNLI